MRCGPAVGGCPYGERRCRMTAADDDEHQALIDIVWPLLARPNCDLWERHQAEQLAARILQALDDAQ